MAKNKQVMNRKKSLSALAVVLFILLFALLFSISRMKSFPENDANIIGNFIEWFGVLYGVLLALVVVEVWQRYSLIISEIDREADALVLLLKTSRYINNKAKLSSIATSLLEYSKTMIKAKEQKEFSSLEITRRLDKIHIEVGSILQENKIPLPLSLEMVRNINDAIDTRGDWISRVKEKMPNGLWVLLLFTSLFWVLGFFGLKIENFLLALTLCGVATFTVSSIIFIIRDLDDPIGGIWHVQFESFEVLKKEALALLKEVKQ